MNIKIFTGKVSDLSRLTGPNIRELLTKKVAIPAKAVRDQQAATETPK